MKIETIYTGEDWSRDRSFSARTGQEIEAEIYEHMYDCMPPLRLADGALNRQLGIVCGFRMGEPYTYANSAKNGLTAFNAAFGKGSNGKFYFLGYQNKYGELFNRETGEVSENK